MSTSDNFSIRATDEDKARFRNFCKESGISQGDGLSSLLQIAEMEKARKALGSRADEIDQFSLLTRKLKDLYLASLEMAGDADERARADYDQDLKDKDSEIADLKERLASEKEVRLKTEQELTEAKKAVSEAEQRAYKAEREAEELRTHETEREQTDETLKMLLDRMNVLTQRTENAWFDQH